MRFCLNSLDRVAVALLAVACVSSTGCKTGWQMPGKDLFSWSKKPSESTLAGKGPSMTYPQNGPAANHTPNQIAGSPSPTTRPYVPGSSSPSTAMATNAASANGYPTGPYTTNANTSATTSGTTASYPSGASAGYPSGVAGYPGSSPAGSNIYSGASSNTVASTPTYNGPSSPYGYRASTSPYVPAGTSGAATGYAANAAAATTGLNAQVNNQVQGVANTFAPPSTTVAGAGMPANGSYVPTGVGTIPNFASPNLSAASTGQTTLPSTLSGSAIGSQGLTTASASVPNGQPAGSYRPGSTGRSTGYDFTNPQQYNPIAPTQQPTMMAVPPNGSSSIIR